MSKKALESLHRINYLTAEIDALYHQASLKLGLSDSAMRTLYTIYDQGSKGEECLLSDIYKQSAIQKQTVNSAIRRLESEGICYLAPNDGRGKKVCLTEKGKAYIQETAARLDAMECRAFASWTDEEIDTHIRLMEKYAGSFREQLQQLR